ncbi:MAG: hypothetical protein WBY93_04135, partial [Candidatus Binatus sp.]
MIPSRWQRIRARLSIFAGPLPLSIFIHVAVLVAILISIQPQRARELININLEAGGGAGDERSPDAELAMPDVPLPATPFPQHLESPPVVDTSGAVSLSNEYARTETLGGPGTMRGGSSGMGSSYGRAIGAGFGGYIGELR